MLPLFILLSSKVRTTTMCAEQIREKVKGKKIKELSYKKKLTKKIKETCYNHVISMSRPDTTGTEKLRGNTV